VDDNFWSKRNTRSDASNSSLLALPITLVILLLFLLPFFLFSKYAGVQLEKHKAEYYNPAVALFNQGKYPAADPKFRAYLAVESEDCLAHYQFGLCLAAEANKSEARKEFQNVMDIASEGRYKRDRAIQALSENARAVMSQLDQPNRTSSSPADGTNGPYPSGLPPSSSYGQ
jgi:hypothetical protein